MLKALATTLALSTIAIPASAADFSDPTWPCVQRKVENLSLGLMWATPLDPEAPAPEGTLSTDIDELAGYLALRRVPLDDIEPRVAAFAETHGGDADALGRVFEKVFNTLSKRRARIIKGIGDFSLSQIALSDTIDANRTEMAELLAADEPDFDRIDALEEQLDWDQIIYTDRQRNITYLCETPTLLERRLFGTAQMLQFAIED